MRSRARATHVTAFTSFARATCRATGKATLFLFSIAALLTVGVAAVRGDSALDGFDPNANDTVRVVVVQPDGKILIAGDFTTIAPNGGASVTRNRIARLNPDGSLDTAFNPNANGSIYAIALQSDGKILVGGFFTNIGAQARSDIARLDPATGLADSFNPSASSGLLSLAVQADGKILAGGFFTGIGGQTRNYLARLDPGTGLADSFDPSANNFVYAIAVQPDGKVLAGGFFTSIGGQTRNRIARLDSASGLADSFDPNANNGVDAIALQADGKILVGGSFTTLAPNGGGAVSRNRIARLDPATGLTDPWNPNANNLVNAIVVQADGKILVSGAFSGANSIGSQARNRMARLDPATGLADSFNPNADDAVYAIAVEADGTILAGGPFTTLTPNGGAAVTRNRIARLESDGRLDRTLNLSTVGNYVIATAVQPDGKILIGGFFASVLGVARNNIARLNSDGTLDTVFNPNADAAINTIAVQSDGKILVGGLFMGANSIGGQARNYIARLNATTGSADSFNPDAGDQVKSIAVQADSKILAGGSFMTIGGQTRSGIARLNATTGLADSFNPNADGPVNSIAVQADAKILAGGAFTTIGGQTRNYIARLSATTGAADSFDPNANNGVGAIALQADGKVLVGGAFNGANSIGGQTRNRIARLNADGTADSFNPNANSEVQSIAVQADGKILVGGFFNGVNSIGGAMRNRIARLDATTGLADSFNPNADSNVHSVAVQADGKILAGGAFTDIGGQSRSRFARLTNDTVASQNLVVTQTSVTWTRAGSSPQFARVTFEDSTDNVSYNFLGNGTVAGSNWTLTGLNLSTGQNLYIRARGYYPGGHFNGSASIQESVRNAFLGVPTPTPTPTQTPTPTATPLVSISGTILYCSNPVPGPVSNVTLTLTGTSSGSILSDVSGNYTFSSLPSGGNYTVTPTKAARMPGSANINTTDVIATQRHFLNLGSPLTGCRLTAADVNGDSNVNTTDVIAIQRFFLGLSTGIANTGKYQFTPANRTYTGLVTSQTGQNYDTLVFGDSAASFVELLDDLSQTEADDE